MKIVNGSWDRLKMKRRITYLSRTPLESTVQRQEELLPDIWEKGGSKNYLHLPTSHKAKTKLYKKRTGLKHVKIADLYPEASAATRVEGEI